MLKADFVAANRRALDGSPPAPAAASPSSASWTRAATSTTPPPCAPAAPSSGWPTSSCCPTTACSTSGALRLGRPAGTLYEVAGVPVGVTICEDAWSPTGPIAEAAVGRGRARRQPQRLALPPGQGGERERLIATRAADASTRHRLRQPGRRPGRVGLRRRLVRRRQHRPAGGRAAAVRAEVVVVDLDVRPVYRKRLLDPRERATGQLLPVVPLSATPAATGPPQPAPTAPLLDPVEEVYRRCAPGLRDYVTKNGFGDVVIGLSGGVDSSLVATLAADALGPEQVHGVLMPSRYSSEHSVADARALADNLGIDGRILPIERPSTPPSRRCCSRTSGSGRPT